jgi:hypothetical protein
MPSKARDESPPPGARRLGGRGLLDGSINRGEVARRVKIVAERLAKLDQVGKQKKFARQTPAQRG